MVIFNTVILRKYWLVWLTWRAFICATIYMPLQVMKCFARHGLAVNFWTCGEFFRSKFFHAFRKTTRQWQNA
ncbi:hypothetical protein XENTR_v10020618 [Xenopus tropicalis]|nr:hypothetical protein XENTR_v10020618 [Xenopus tropicalis]